MNDLENTLKSSYRSFTVEIKKKRKIHIDFHCINHKQGTIGI